MRTAILLSIAGFIAIACKPPEKVTPPPAHATAAQVALADAAIFIGVGDIGMCGLQGDEQTAILVDSVLKADSAAKVPVAVFTLGDNAYPAGLDRDFVRCFGSSWGDPKKSIMKYIRPSIGNHDYQSDYGAAYYRYFGKKAGPSFKGYYSYDLGDWHVIALNSEIAAQGGLADRSAQEDWLRKDLKEHSKLCSVAYLHRPLYSSGAHGASPIMVRMWKILADGGVDLVLAGHEHHYERFLPMNSSGAVDSLNGMEEIIAGTGGGNLTGIRSQVAFGSVIQIQGHWGVLIATLGKEEYRTSFLDVNGQAWDPSGRKCH